MPRKPPHRPTLPSPPSDPGPPFQERLLPSNYVERDALAEGLRNLAGRSCGYTGRSCDCKYGCPPRGVHGSEQTGCPEAASAAVLVSCLTKKEYERLVKKAERRASLHNAALNAARRERAKFLTSSSPRAPK